jgi:hypothetical protein
MTEIAFGLIGIPILLAIVLVVIFAIQGDRAL